MRFFLMLLFLLPTAAMAEQSRISDLLNLPADHSIIQLSASENIDVEQDLLTAQLSVKAMNDNPTDLQNDINTAMKKALDASSAYDDIQAQTLNYNIREFHPNPKDRSIKTWKGVQTVSFKSTHKDSVLKLVGELQQQGLILDRLSFSVSQKLRDQTKDALLEKVIQKLQVKANRAAKALYKTKADLLEIAVQDQSGSSYQPQFRSVQMETMALSAAPSVPSVSAGQTNISISASAYGLLKP